jgi:hypothetical protein
MELLDQMDPKRFNVAKLCHSNKAQVRKFTGKVLLTPSVIAAVDAPGRAAIIARHSAQNAPTAAIPEHVAEELAKSTEPIVWDGLRAHTGQKWIQVESDLDPDEVQQSINEIHRISWPAESAVTSVMVDLQLLIKVCQTMVAVAGKPKDYPALLRVVAADLPITIESSAGDVKCLLMPMRTPDDRGAWPTQKDSQLIRAFAELSHYDKTQLREAITALGNNATRGLQHLAQLLEWYLNS